MRKDRDGRPGKRRARTKTKLGAVRRPGERQGRGKAECVAGGEAAGEAGGVRTLILGASRHLYKGRKRVGVVSL